MSEDKKVDTIIQEDNTILILSASPYSFPDKNTGEMRTGCTIEYISSDSPVSEDSDFGSGFKTMKSSLPLDIYDKFKNGISLAQPIYKPYVNKERQRVSKLVDIRYIKTVNPFK